MSWFSKEEKTVATDLGSLAEKHKATEEDLAREYEAGLAIVKRVREDAKTHAQRLQAEAALLLRAADSVAQRFVVDAPTIPAKGLNTPSASGWGITAVAPPDYGSPNPEVDKNLREANGDDDA